MASQMNRIDNRSSYSNHLMNPIVTTTPTITTKSIFPIIDEENGYKRNYFKGTIPSSTSSPFFTSNNQRILTSQEISNNDNIINDNINERYTKHTTTIPTTTNNHLELSKSPIQKSMEPTSPSVDYLLFDAPPWMKQSKMKNSKFINHNTNYHSTISSNIITAATTTITTTTATTTRKLSSPPLSNIKDTKMNIDNITIIRKDNNNNNHNVIRSSSPRSNGSFRFVKSGSCRFPEKNPKLNPPSYMQKLDDIVIEDEMNTESFITSKNNKFNLTKNLDHNDHWITHDPSHKFTPISSPTFIKTTNIPSNEIIQSKYKENKNVLQSNINKSIYERTIHSTPSSPTMERIQRDSRTHQRTEETKTEKLQPQRTSSQMNISGPSTMTKTAWLSETNLRNSTTCKQPPMYSTYSAHKENMRRMQEQRRTTEDWQASNRQLHDSRSVGSRAVLEEMETITLQPIGRGVHDLEPPTGSIARSVRATTPSGLSTFPTLLNRPHSSAGRIDLSVSGIKRSISKDYYSPIRMQRSTIDIPYSQTTQALISPPINRRLVGFANLGHSSRISSINKSVLLPTIHHDPIIYGNHIVNNQSPELINQSYMNRNSYARQTLTQNIQEITQKQRLLSPNQQYYATPSYNKLANRSYAPGLEQQDGFRTIATTNYHREMHTSGPQSPYLGTMRQNSQYEATPIVNRSIVQQSVIPFSPNGSLSGTNIGVDIVDGDTVGMRQVLDTSKYWYLPGISRPDVIALLRDKEPGSFVIRNSNTYADSFGLALKIPPSSPRIISNKDDIQSEWVRHFLIGTVPMHDGRGNGVHLRGFSSDPTFPSLAAFVHYHIHKQGALPCTLRLPLFTNQTLFNQQRTLVNEQTVYGLEPSLQTILPTTNTMNLMMLNYDLKECMVQKYWH
ncbi:putative tensin [Schistosoma mansoni]|uniref:putative tensin n=1 Tax=Schistosoma mansoni TaxID=6183 RepID=UPI00022DC12B|nr:putative tensin [Schistosoma mansoni]|eukprot:XP_018653676.1 putative tensin [Schistosoma mansoni]